MSGILATVSLNGAPVDGDLIERMTAAMAFRGPDGSSTWADGTAGLGCALFRTGPVAGDDIQPRTLDGTSWIVADARIDGRRELLGRLRQAGRVVLEDSCDADLVLHAYHAWGEQCVDHLIGDFVFAIWDTRQQTLFCARDHFGVAPLYYAIRDGLAVLSNTLDCVLMHPAVSDQLNEQAIGDFLLVGFNLDSSTSIYQDVQRLPAAHTLSIGPGSVRVRRYWEVPTPGRRAEPRPERDVVAEFLETFREAVADRMRAPSVAIAMSGGLDSPAMAAVAHSIRDNGGPAPDIRVYSIGFDWLIPDVERYYAGLAGRHIGASQKFLTAEESFIVEREEDAFVNFAEPRLTHRKAAIFAILSHERAAGGRVVLDGLGGDPLLMLPTFYWRGLLRNRDAARLLSEGFRYRRTRGSRPPLYLRSEAARWLANFRGSIPDPQPVDWINPEFARRLGLRERLHTLMVQSESPDGLAAMVNQMWPEVLSAGDPGFSRVPMRAHHPFFDLRLVRFLDALPAVPWRFNKTILRSAMKDFLPEPVLRRRKTPLSVDYFHESATWGFEPWYERLATNEEIAEFVNVPKLRAAVREPSGIPMWQFQSRVLNPVSLAFWLEHRKRRDKPIEAAHLQK